jgi:hypothetical protein
MKPTTRKELLAECACFDLRKATRAVSRMYDEFLRGRQSRNLNASTDSDFEPAFAAIAQQHIDALSDCRGPVFR